MRTSRPARPLLAVLVVLAAALGCEAASSIGPSFDRNRSGTGTSTLHVIADIQAEDVSNGFTTMYTVAVRDAASAPVSGATVRIVSSTDTLTLTETVAASGDYAALRSGFPSGDFTLSVVRGTDTVRDVVVGGPGIHTITEPLPNTTQPALKPLTVRWTVPSQARMAELETRDHGPVTLPDTGAYVISAAANKANPAQRIRVWRYNEVAIAGGIVGSRFRVKVRHTVEPLIVQ